MKKFFLRLYSLLVVFCLVFFSFPLVSFASSDLSSYPYKYSLDVSFPGATNSWGDPYPDRTHRFATRVPCLALIEYQNERNYRLLFVPTDNGSARDSDLIGLNSDGSISSFVLHSDSLISGFRYFDVLYGSDLHSFVFSNIVGFKYVGPYFDSVESRTEYVKNNIGSPDPIVNNYQSSLGSFVMASGQNSWANNFYGEHDYQGVFTSRVQNTTSTGKVAGVDFDSFQFYTGLSDCKRVGMVPKSFGTFVDNKIHNGDGLKNGRGGLALDVKYPSDFVSALQQLMNADSGLGNTVQLVFNKILGGGYEFKPVVFLRPFDTKSGAYGDWIRVTAGAVSSSSMNSSGTGSSVSGSSSEDPDKTDFVQNSDPVITTGTTASGTTLDNAINNAITFSPVVNVNPDINVNVNNNVSNELQQIQNASSSSGGQVTGGILSNIVGLLGLVGAVPQMLTVLFSWLPAWSLAVVGVAFALFVPVIIFKLLK